MAGQGRDPAYDRFAEEIIEAVQGLITSRTGRFLTHDGKIRLGRNTTVGRVPEVRGGWRDHAHNGVDAQQLAEANTHQALDIDPATAIHWTREMIQDMIAAFLEDQNGNPFVYNDAGDRLTIESGAGSAWSVLTNGDPVAPELIFDSFGDVIMTETPR